MKIKENQRGFQYGNFKDRYGSECSIQDSSLAAEACIWLGVDKAFNHDFECTRMHLNRKMVENLLPLLQKFIKTGSIN